MGTNQDDLGSLYYLLMLHFIHMPMSVGFLCKCQYSWGGGGYKTGKLTGMRLLRSEIGGLRELGNCKKEGLRELNDCKKGSVRRRMTAKRGF